MSLQNVINPPTIRNFTFLPTFPFSFTPSQKTPLAQTLKFHVKLCCISPSFQYSINQQDGFIEDEDVIGDCLVFEEGIFEDPFLENDNNHEKPLLNKHKSRKKSNDVEPENLVPDKWKEVQAEINITKKDRRKIARELEYGRRVEKRKEGYLPLRSVSFEEYKAYKEAKLAQLRPVVLDNPISFPVKEQDQENGGERKDFSSDRVEPKNPRWAVYGKGLEDVSEFFNSGSYVPGSKNSDGPRKLFTMEEKVLLNRRVPDLATASSEKWLPLHTLAASGEFYLVDALLKHNVDINAADKDGLTALHKAIIGKKQAITNYLLRESANPFVCDKEGATLLHYAVQTASSQAIKILLLYNVDINLQDDYGWTPLHLAVQIRRTDVVRLLLIKGADKLVKNKDGLTPLELCLHLGHDLRTFELIKLLKKLPKSRAAGVN